MNIRDLLLGNSPVSRLSPISINSASSDLLPDANTIGADLIDHKYDAEWDAWKSDDPPVSFEFHNTSFDSFSHDEVDGDEDFPHHRRRGNGKCCVLIHQRSPFEVVADVSEDPGS
ncbi:hypothetical protein C8J56DRAFT_1043250 [Mycena floridula]|nr:hypothetical protein C8J56DRAFT_1043250 [Mycena floridula]